MDKFSQAFEADTGKILNIVINSLYSDRDIFLRELLSNASDAIQKRRFMGQTIPDLLNPNDDQIEIIVDKKKKTIEIIDTGIGLNKKELAETLGTIAQSGTANFLKENDFKKLLLTHYSFLKRPVLLFNNKIYIGNSQKTVEEAEIELCKN